MMMVLVLVLYSSNVPYLMLYLRLQAYVVLKN